MTYYNKKSCDQSLAR